MNALELSGRPEGLMDEPPVLRVRGAGGARGLVWRGRIRDDDGRVWRAIADRPEDLPGAWVPAKASTSMLMAVASLRPVELEVRVEAADGRAATRALRRLFVGDGVRVRRWRDGVTATLHLPPGDGPFGAVVVDATGPEDALAVATLAAPLLASRGVVALVVGPPRRGSAGDALAAASRSLASVPVASREPARVLLALPAQEDGAAREPGTVVVTPPGVGVRGAGAGPVAAAARAASWDALLAALGAVPRPSA